MTDKKPRVFITTRYENLGSEEIESVDFVKAVEVRLAEKYSIVEEDRAQDHFFVFLGFARIDEKVTAVSAVLGFHESSESSDADYLLQNYTGYFFSNSYPQSAENLVAALDEQIMDHISQGWWEG